MFVSHVAALLSCAGAAIAVRPVDHRNAGNAIHGTLVVTTVGFGAVTAVLAMLENTKPSRMPCRHASMFCLMTSAVSGVPSWNVTPERFTIVHCVKSAFGVIDSAR